MTIHKYTISICYLEKKDALIIKDNAKDKQLNCKSLAEECGVSRIYFSEVLNGKKPCTITIAKVIKKYKLFDFKGAF